MLKKGKKRWFLLQQGVLYWFAKEQPPSSDFRKATKGSIQLDSYTATTSGSNDIILANPTTNYVLTCTSLKERNEWISSIRKQLDQLNKVCFSFFNLKINFNSSIIFLFLKKSPNKNQDGLIKKVKKDFLC